MIKIMTEITIHYFPINSFLNLPYFYLLDGNKLKHITERFIGYILFQIMIAP